MTVKTDEGNITTQGFLGLYNPCIGGCGVSTRRSMSYCVNCEPEEDITQYDIGGSSDQTRN